MTKAQGFVAVHRRSACAGVAIRPIRDLAGESHFNEVVFQDVFLPDDLIGAEGDGWGQSSPNWRSSVVVPSAISAVPRSAELLRMAGTNPGRGHPRPWVLLAEMVVLRQMSLSIAGQLERAEPQRRAACVKDLGTLLEQRLPEVAHELFETAQRAGWFGLRTVLAYIASHAVVFVAWAREIPQDRTKVGLGS